MKKPPAKKTLTQEKKPHAGKTRPEEAFKTNMTPPSDLSASKLPLAGSENRMNRQARVSVQPP
jgi:hypothetical protein